MVGLVWMASGPARAQEFDPATVVGTSLSAQALTRPRAGSLSTVQPASVIGRQPVVLLYTWLPPCSPICRQAMDAYDAAATALGPSAPRRVLMIPEEDPEDDEETHPPESIRWPVLAMSRRRSVLNRLTTSVPLAIWLDARGRIVAVRAGFDAAERSWITAQLPRLARGEPIESPVRGRAARPSAPTPAPAPAAEADNPCGASLYQLVVEHHLRARDLRHAWMLLRTGGLPTEEAGYDAARAPLIVDLAGRVSALELYAHDLGDNPPDIRPGDILVYSLASRPTGGAVLVHAFDRANGSATATVFLEDRNISERSAAWPLRADPTNPAVRLIRPGLLWLRPRPDACGWSPSSRR